MNILHKLGLYKKSEIDELIESTVNLLSSVDGVIDYAKIQKKLADTAIKMLTDVEVNAKIIKGYCAGTDCFACRFCRLDNTGRCIFTYTPPCDWEV